MTSKLNDWEKIPFAKKDLAVLIEKLSDGSQQGTALGNSFYKICLAIASCKELEQITKLIP